MFVCTSHYESFLLPVLEAMSSGCAVVTTKNKGIVEYAEDGKKCIMFAMQDPEAMAEKIIHVIENDTLRKKDNL